MGRGARFVAAALAALAGCAAVAGDTPTGAVGENWIARRIYDAFRNETRCVVETPRHTLHDGYQDTAVFLRMDGRSLMVMTDSSLDVAHPDVGLSVDGRALIRPDRVFLEQNALFETDIAPIIAQFKAGAAVEVRLHFWPTWPSKGPRTVTFSLIGYTRAFARLPGC
jgi:hypothetical protein